MPDNVIVIEGLDLGYDGEVLVPDFNLAVETDEFVSLLGPSGCGKTTVLRAIAGFLPVMAGRIQLEGRDISSSGTRFLHRGAQAATSASSCRSFCPCCSP